MVAKILGAPASRRPGAGSEPAPIKAAGPGHFTRGLALWGDRIHNGQTPWGPADTPEDAPNRQVSCTTDPHSSHPPGIRYPLGNIRSMPPKATGRGVL